MGKKRITDLDSMEDVNISILAFLSENSSPSIEINRIKAKDDISVTLNRFYHRSPDYCQLIDRLTAQEHLVHDNTLSKEARAVAEGKLKELQKLEAAFKVDVLHLAAIFLRIDNYSERLVAARSLFEQGRFSAADQLLAENDLQSTQSDLLLAADYWERRIKRILT